MVRKALISGKKIRQFVGMALLYWGGTGCREVPPPPVEHIMESGYLYQQAWEERQVEEVHYRGVSVPYPEDTLQVTTRMLLHTFDPVEWSGASGEGMAAFKYVIIPAHAEESAWEAVVVHAAQEQLRPFRQTWAFFDGYGVSYQEMDFYLDDRVTVWGRSDDLGNFAEHFPYTPHIYPIGQLPMVIRALDFSQRTTHQFQVVRASGEKILATAVYEGAVTLATLDGIQEAEKIQLRLEEEIRFPMFPAPDTVFWFWRAKTGTRPLLQINSGDYQLWAEEIIGRWG